MGDKGGDGDGRKGNGAMMDNVVEFGGLRHMACYYMARAKEAAAVEFKRKQQEIADSYRLMSRANPGGRA